MTDLDAVLAGVTIWPHQVETVRRTADHFAADENVVALLLTGSIAHGFATAESDVDIVIVVSRDEFARREAATALTFLSYDLASYEGGYVDGKYVSVDMLTTIARGGGDATRWGYEGARVLLSRDERVARLVSHIVRFPDAEASVRRERFVAQLLAWRWYHEQGVSKNDPYLRGNSLSRVVLFACRLVLNENAQLFPFHKWMLRVTAGVPHRPASLLDDIAVLYADPTQARVDALVYEVLEHYAVDVAAAERTWGALFMRDTEMAWVKGPPDVGDL